MKTRCWGLNPAPLRFGPPPRRAHRFFASSSFLLLLLTLSPAPLLLVHLGRAHTNRRYRREIERKEREIERKEREIERKERGIEGDLARDGDAADGGATPAFCPRPVVALIACPSLLLLLEVAH
jgi:hypothetical protein